MKSIARPLVTNEQIISFLEVIDFSNYFKDTVNACETFPGMKSVDAMMAKSIVSIKEANEDLLDVVNYNTFKSDKYRTYPFDSDKQRQKLRDLIVEELLTNIRPNKDEEICLGTGGMLPSTGYVKAQRKAIIVIGLPASGKSGIAAKISDFYNAILIDSDFAKRKIPEFCKTNGATLVHEESKIIKDDVLNYTIYKGINLVLPIIGSEYDGVMDTIRNFKRHKYEVSLILVELDRVKATQRAFSRFIQTKRYIPLSNILDDYSNNPSLVFYKLLSNSKMKDLPVALIDTDVPRKSLPKIIMQRNFQQIHKIIKEV